MKITIGSCLQSLDLESANKIRIYNYEFFFTIFNGIFFLRIWNFKAFNGMNV